MSLREQRFRIERFPSGRQPDQSLLTISRRDNEAIGANAGKYTVAYREHVSNSRQFILDSATGLTGKAILFGMGQGIDIPLEDLARQFKELVVVDIDESTTARRLLTLDPDLQEKFTLIIEDLSGMLLTLGNEFAAVERRVVSLPSFLSSMAEVFKGLEPALPDFGKDYSFASSSLVTTQLASQPHIGLSTRAKEKFSLSGGMVQGLEAIDYFTSLTSLAERLQVNHIDLIKGCLLPDGRAYYSDTVAEVATAINPLTQEVVMVGDWKLMVQPNLLNHDIPGRFDILEEREWLWDRIPPTMRNLGSVFSVLALNLQPVVRS